MVKTVAGALAASLHFQEVRKVQWRESKLVDGVIAFIKERREYFGTVSSCEVDGYSEDLMSGEEASGVEQLHELRWTWTRSSIVKRQNLFPISHPRFPWPPNALYLMPMLSCSFCLCRYITYSCDANISYILVSSCGDLQKVTQLNSCSIRIHKTKQNLTRKV